MIHEIEQHKFNNEFIECQPAERDYFVAFSGNAILMYYSHGVPSIPRCMNIFESFPVYFEEIYKSAYYLFSIDDSRYFLVTLPEEVKYQTKVFNDYEDVKEELGFDKASFSFTAFFFLSIHNFRELDPIVMDFAGATAYHINNWLNLHKFCGYCGCKLVKSTEDRRLVCEACGHDEYPDISPAVIVAVTDGDRILLVRNKRGPYKKYSLVSGYVEIGESFEAACEREVFEETGVHIKNIRYYKNQPWGISSAQMIGFVAELDGSDAISIQESELSEALWFKRDEMPERTSRLSVGAEMMAAFKDGRL